MGAFCIALMDRLVAGKRASCETKEGPPDNAAGGRVGVAAPPSNCHLPVRKVPGWRAFGFPPASWAAPRRMPGAEEAGEGGTPPWWPDAYVLPGSPLLLFTCPWSWWYPRV